MSTTSLLRKLVGTATPPLLPLSGRARGAAIGFRPMAVLRDQEQAFKPEGATSSGALPTPARPATVSHAAPTQVQRHFRLFRTPSQNLLTHSTARSTPARPSRPARPSGRLALSGTFSSVCAELERLVAQEERYLRAG